MKKPSQFLTAALLSWISAILAGVCVWLGAASSPALAQDNPIPLNWRNLTVQVIETYGNNNTKPLQGAKVKVELKYPERARELLNRYPTLHLPVTKTAQTRGALFGKLPPSKDVGPYVVTVIPKPHDTNREYICEEQNKKDTREILMGGGSDHRLTFNYTCKKADTVNEFNRRAKGGYDLTVKINESGGTRGYGLWVHLYDKNGNRIKKIRTGGAAEAKFRKIDPSYNPYKVEVYRINKLLHTSNYDMPYQNATYTVDLDAPGRGGYGGNGNGSSYNLTVKLDLWVHLYDKNGKLLKKLRLDNTGKAVFSQIKSKYNPYKIAVYSYNKLLYSDTYEMPEKHSTYTVD